MKYNEVMSHRIFWKKKSAFTLAEVLITLGIIGVVAALTVPAIITKYKKVVTIAKLKKTYSILNQIAMHSIDDNWISDLSSLDFNAEAVENYFKTYWQPYFKDSIVISENGYQLYGTSRPFSGLNGSAGSIGILTSYSEGRIYFTTSDGTGYCLMLLTYVNDGDNTVIQFNSKPSVFVDINGTKKPNTFGKDVFIFDFYENTVKPRGANQNMETLNNNCSLNATGSGEYCTAKIMKDGWEINYW